MGAKVIEGSVDKEFKTSEEVVIPCQGESAAISLKPKTAALCYDRIWATSDAVVPRAIRCWGGSPAELNGRGLAADWNIQTKRAPIVAMCGPDEKRLQLLRASTDYGLGLIIREVAKSFSAKYGITMVPIYALSSDRETEFHEGTRQVLVATLSNLEIVDEQQLTWEQVIEFRDDEQTKQKYRRLLHWLDRDMVGKSEAFIHDEICQRLEDYESSLKKHGVKTVVGIIQEVLDGKYLAGVSDVSSPFVLAGHPTLGVLAGAGLIVARVVVKIAQVLLDFDDVERGPNSEISWVYEVKRIGK